MLGVISNLSFNTNDFSKIASVVIFNTVGAFLALMYKDRLFRLSSTLLLALIVSLLSITAFTGLSNTAGILIYIFVTCLIHVLISIFQAEISLYSFDNVMEQTKLFQIGNTLGSIIGMALSPILGGARSLNIIIISCITVSIITLFINKALSKKKSPLSPEKSSHRSKINPIALIKKRAPLFVFIFLVWVTGGFFYIIEIPILTDKFKFSSVEISFLFFLTAISNLTATILIKNFSSKINLHFILYSAFACIVSAFIYATNNSYILVIPILILYGFFNGLLNFSYLKLIQDETEIEEIKNTFLFLRIIAQIGLLVSSLASLSMTLGQINLVLGLVLVISIAFIKYFLSELKISKVIIVIILLVSHTNNTRASELKIKVESLPSKIDPSRIFDASSALINNQIFDQLFVLDEQDFLVPNLIDKVVWSEDYKELFLRVNKNIKFSDKTSLKASDVTESLSRTIKILGEDSRWAFGAIKGFDQAIEVKNKSTFEGLKVIDNLSFKISFISPSPYFTKILATPYFSIFKETPSGFIGTGKYKLSKFDGQNKIISLILSEKSKAEKSFKSLLFSDQTNFKSDISFSQKNDNPELNKFEFKFLQSVVMVFNVNSNLFSSRQNRCYFSKKSGEIIDKSSYNFVPINIGLPLSWSLNNAKKTHEGNPNKSLLNKKISILFANSAAQFDESKHLKIIQLFKKSDILISFQKHTIKELHKELKAKNFDVAILGYIPDYIHPDALLSPFLLTNQQFNYSGYSNKDLDKLLILAKSSNDPKHQLNYYNRAFEILDHDCPVYFLGSQSGYYFHKKNLKIPPFSSLGFHNLKFHLVQGE
jgi:hypothetical protein